MNKYRRMAIAEIIEKLTEARDELEFVKDEEEEAFENYPENLQNSKRSEAMQDAIETLDVAVSEINEAIERLEWIT